MVASVGVITAGRGYDYLTKEVATSKHDYYTGTGEAPGRWAGRAAGLLGLSGEVDAEDMAVLYGRFIVPSTAGGTRVPVGAVGARAGARSGGHDQGASGRFRVGADGGVGCHVLAVELGVVAVGVVVEYASRRIGG